MLVIVVGAVNMFISVINLENERVKKIYKYVNKKITKTNNRNCKKKEFSIIHRQLTTK